MNISTFPIFRFIKILSAFLKLRVGMQVDYTYTYEKFNKRCSLQFFILTCQNACNAAAVGFGTQCIGKLLGRCV
jgi:hypothetical protein